ncbi:hypothetical protein BDQ17DRAFT_1371908 [Cyathus striatus]|nr:hypothetical protein BDQ17DRAFT_1371908 [Cyathus striatus]
MVAITPADMFRFLTLSLTVTLQSLLACQTSAATYDLTKEYSGVNFFQDWDFFDGYDNTTLGDETYLGAQAAALANLTFVDTQTKRAFLKVDNITNVPFNQKRNSVKITTNATYDMGSLWIVDVFHAPYGCGVWPSIWSWAPQVGSGSWPEGGGINTFEAVNQDIYSHSNLHTNTGCNANNSTPNQNTASIVNTTDCSDPLLGCLTTIAGHPSYGPDFNSRGGGIFITEYASTGISVWFFNRDSIPSPVNSSSIDTSKIGTPVANWPASICGPDGFSQVFLPQSLVIDIALCGSLGSSLYNETCPPGNCYTNTVAGNGSNFAEAYFEIDSIRVFTSNITTSLTHEDGGPVRHTKGIIIGIILGTLFGVLAICSGAYIVYKRRKSRSSEPVLEEEWPRPAPFITTQLEGNTTLYNPMFVQPIPNSPSEKTAGSVMVTTSGDGLRSPAITTADFSTAGATAIPVDTARLLHELDSLRRELAEVRASAVLDPPPTYYRGSEGGH